MDAFFFVDPNGRSSLVKDFILEHDKYRIDIYSIIFHLVNSPIGSSPKFAKPCRGKDAKCHDGKDIYEMKIDFKPDLVRVFFVTIDDKMVLYYVFTKPNIKGDYNKCTANRVALNYQAAFKYVREAYKMTINGEGYLEEIVFQINK
jgi:hypothetical protein